MYKLFSAEGNDNAKTLQRHKVVDNRPGDYIIIPKYIRRKMKKFVNCYYFLCRFFDDKSQQSLQNNDIV